MGRVGFGAGISGRRDGGGGVFVWSKRAGQECAERQLLLSGWEREHLASGQQSPGERNDCATGVLWRSNGGVALRMIEAKTDRREIRATGCTARSTAADYPCFLPNSSPPPCY